MKTKLLAGALALAFTLTFARANFVSDGGISFSGEFTINHNYWFSGGTQPFGWLTDQTVQSVSGVFASHVHAGDILAGQALWMPGYPGAGGPTFALDGYTFTSFYSNIAGADMAGEAVYGLTDLTGNNTKPGAFGTSWYFTAPVYDISNMPNDVTGVINFSIGASHDNGWVPEGGSTALLLGLALLPLALFKARGTFQPEKPAM